MVRESKKLYEGTDMEESFVIYQDLYTDHLKVMWEKIVSSG